PQPANVHIARYIPQSSLLPHCSLVVSHGGSGSVIGALAHGLPMVLIPMGADQPLNAARCADLGVARVLDAVTATPEAAREAAAAVLADPAYRRAAERLRDEIAVLPGPEHAVALLERLAAEKRPLLSA
ncbi:MAG TPA: nucleotide disphospho-sugar-binding domain-containing protein, partial [Herpetosiphonaceae bacterium]|nr:nucleotide disphospho-sugar-binding domain-containing protein [Herpetosiphonaceae bacterium]